MLLVLTFIFYDRLYTFTTFTVLITVVLVLEYVVKIGWSTRFYITYAFLLLPFFIVNGMLTGFGLDQPVVQYNDAENMGIRLITIPCEDVF